ncbi:hypothetical protein [Desulfosporosinus acididurans]|uniref:hypothetical protein n=1 Tax=Desulfosporosinus acididurans TaxID=476652 RepID=UPI000A9E77BC|nr:hypothetical protein [Desulfosporosinus acididurans]
MLRLGLGSGDVKSGISGESGMIFCLGQIKKELTKQSLSGVGLGIEMETELWVTAQK